MAIADLSKWNFSIEFLLYEAAALIVGIDPAEVYVNTDSAKENQNIYDYHKYPLIKPVVDRMKYDYLSAVELYASLHEGAWRHASPAPLPESVLRSREMEIIPLQINAACLPLDQASQEILENWRVSDEDLGTYEVVKFTRQELSRWLSAIGVKSAYQFQLERENATDKLTPEKDNISPVVLKLDFDPEDLPEELDAANVAFRAVLNGYGDQNATPRNRLVDYLRTTYLHLKPEAIQRIATVANPDKTRGRKSLIKQ